MGQQEVYDFLKNKWMSNDYSFYSVKDIYLSNREVLSFKSVSCACKNLYNKGRFIERKMFDNVPKYRLNIRML